MQPCPRCQSQVKPDESGQLLELIGTHSPGGKEPQEIWDFHICMDLRLKINEAVAAHPTGDEQAVKKIKEQVIEESKTLKS